jgi:hypothetical protein
MTAAGLVVAWLPMRSPGAPSWLRRQTSPRRAFGRSSLERLLSHHQVLSAGILNSARKRPVLKPDEFRMAIRPAPRRIPSGLFTRAARPTMWAPSNALTAPLRSRGASPRTRAPGPRKSAGAPVRGQAHGARRSPHRFLRWPLGVPSHPRFKVTARQGKASAPAKPSRPPTRPGLELRTPRLSSRCGTGRNFKSKPGTALVQPLVALLLAHRTMSSRLARPHGDASFVIAKQSSRMLVPRTCCSPCTSETHCGRQLRSQTDAQLRCLPESARAASRLPEAATRRRTWAPEPNRVTGSSTPHPVRRARPLRGRAPASPGRWEPGLVVAPVHGWAARGSRPSSSSPVGLRGGGASGGVLAGPQTRPFVAADASTGSGLAAA